MPPRLQRGVVAIQCDRNPFRFKGVAHVVDPRCVKRLRMARRATIRARCRRAPRLRQDRRSLGPAMRCAGTGGCPPTRIGRQHVTAGLAGDPHVGAGEQLTQSRHVCRQGVARPVRKVVRPDPVDQLVGRDRTVDVDQQRREDASLASVTDVQATPVEQSLDVAEQPELHRHRVQLLPGRPSYGRIRSFAGS